VPMWRRAGLIPRSTRAPRASELHPRGLQPA
jgi:hypothetical protein